MNVFKNLFSGDNKKRIIIVSLVAIAIVSACGYATYQYQVEQERIEQERIAEEKRKAKEREEKKLAELRKEHAIEGITSVLSEKYVNVITDNEKSLILNYEEYMMTTHKVDDFEKYKGELDELVAQLDTRLSEWEAEQQRIAEEEARKAREAEEAKKKQEQQYSSGGGSNYPSGGGVLTPSGGVNWFNNRKEMYYNLNMSQVVANAHAMGIQGDYWVRGDGVKMLGGYIMVASSDLPKGTIVETSLGTAIVVDAGCASGVIDVAVTW